MVRVNNTNQSATRSSVFFGDDSPSASPSQRRTMRSPAPSDQRATSPTPSSASSANSRFSNYGARNSNLSMGDDRFPPTPPSSHVQAHHVQASSGSQLEHHQEARQASRPLSPTMPAPKLANLPTSPSSSSTSSSTETVLAEMQAKLDAQNALLLDMFAYIRRIDKDVGSIGDEVSVLRSRLERM
ncbi:hypothetical protein BDR26DRAFT_10671 [Obelidium mucronatum]|nr:hypothetical protein BDR26DRAFT_10671 [Obelidium mucronatum]